MEASNRVLKIEITGKTILFTILVILLLKALFLLKNIFLNLFVAFIFMSALKPSVDFLDKKNVPRVLAAILVIIISVGILITFLYYALPPLAIQTKDFFLYASKQLFLTLQKLDKQISVRDFLQFQTFSQHIPDITNAVTKIIVSIFSNVLDFISILFFTLYFLLEVKHLEKLAARVLSKRQASFFMETLTSVEKQLGAWVRGELILMLAVGILSYTGLSLLQVNYALPLAVIAGLLEVFPIIGPILSVFPAFFVAATTSWILGIAVIALYIIIQQLENNLIVPLVMKTVVGIPPLAVLISLLIGQKLAGFTGIILAVPIVATLVIVLKEIFKYKEQETKQETTATHTSK